MEGTYRGKNFDVKDGQFFYYYNNGRLATDCIYNDCKTVGLYRTYSKKGILTDSMRFKSNGILYHKCYSWNDSGVLIYFGDFDQSGSGKGYETEYYDDGKISAFGKYEKGQVKDSTWTYYYRAGAVSCVEKYDSGKLKNTECFTVQGIKQDTCNPGAIFPETGYNILYYVRDKFIKTNLYPLFRKYNYPGEFNLYVEITLNDQGKIDIVMIEECPEEIYTLLRAIFQSLPQIKPAMEKNRPLTVKDDLVIPIKMRIGWSSGGLRYMD